jgi:hypothetical protein
MTAHRKLPVEIEKRWVRAVVKLAITIHIRRYTAFCARYLPFKCGMAPLFSLQTYSSNSVSTINVTG